MSLKKITTLTALAVAAAIGFSGSANASFSYATSFAVGAGGTSFSTVQTDSTNGAPGTIIYSGVSSNFGGNTSAPLGTVTYSNSGSPASFSANYTIQLAITNGAATSSFYIFGTLSGSGVFNTGNGTFTNTWTGMNTVDTFSTNMSAITELINGVPFTIIPPVSTTNPISGSLAGAFSATISTVPEPASAVMVGLGLGGVGLVCLRKRRR